METRTLLKALRDLFLKPGQSITEFVLEWKALTDKDKADYRRILIAEGIPLEPEHVYIPML